jgi:hypothetical protein
VKGDDYAASEIIANGKSRCINDDVRFTYSASPRRLDLGYFVNGQEIGTAILFPN